MTDLIDLALGAPASETLKTLRDARTIAREQSQLSFEALLGSKQSAGLSSVEREAVAVRVASLHGCESLVAIYQGRLDALGGSPTSPRVAAMRLHAELLSMDPAAARPAHLQALSEAGLTAAEIVTLSQLIGFVSYQVRVVVGLQGLLGRDAGAPHADDIEPISAGEGGLKFTLDLLDWKPWIDAKPLAECDDEQLAVLDASNRSARQSAYYLTLVHDAPALLHRSLLFNAVMYATGGLSRAEREFATVVESRINGCPYCASVHARFFVQLAKDLPTMQGLLEHGPDAPMPQRLRAIADHALALTATPPRSLPATIARLREVGLSDLEILDATHAVAMFAWANRLMQTLGEPFLAPAT